VIEYTLPKGSHVRLEVYNAAGQKLLTLVDEDERAGCRSAELSTARLASGTYFYRLQAGKYTSTKRMIVVR